MGRKNHFFQFLWANNTGKNEILNVTIFFKDGKLINVIRGCNGPVLNEYIINQLKKERDILEGKAERTVVSFLS